MAVACVVVVHLFVYLDVVHAGTQFWRISRFAVLLFFVHTCLVLMYSLERQYARDGWRRLFNHFMIRRLFRLYPLCILIVLAVYFLRIPAADFHAHTFVATDVGPGGLLANLALVQNLTYAHGVIAQLWSLPLEIQMYLLLPALFLFARRWKSLRPLLLLWIGAVAVAGIQPLISDRLSIVQFIPNFLPGVIAYRESGVARPTWPAFWWPLMLCAMAGLYMVTLTFEHGWILCLITGLTVNRFRQIRLSWLRRAAHLLAKYSYGIYLTHMLAVWVGFELLGAFSPALRWTIFAVTLVALPLILYHTIEAPLTRFGATLAQRWYPARHAPPRDLPDLDETTPQDYRQLESLLLPAAATKQHRAGDGQGRERDGHRPRHALRAQAEMAGQPPRQRDFPEPEAE
jgi:peptidoglycan/LPS O-acetylase OafA/YrhL